MPYDANLVLRGKYGATVAAAAYVDLDSSDAAATGLAVASTVSFNNDGNSVVDLGDHGTGPLGMDCIIIQHDQATSYTNYADYVIEDSDNLTGGWGSLLTFPRVYAYIIEVIVTATTAYLATDIGQVCTESSDVGVIREISRKLLTIGGTGKLFVEMQSSGDTYPTSGAAITTTTGTGAGTQVGAGRIPNWVSGGLTMVRRFSTPKRYIRLGKDAPNGGNFGDVDVLVTGSQHSYVNNLYR